MTTMNSYVNCKIFDVLFLCVYLKYFKLHFSDKGSKGPQYFVNYIFLKKHFNNVNTFIVNQHSVSENIGYQILKSRQNFKPTNWKPASPLHILYLWTLQKTKTSFMAQLRWRIFPLCMETVHFAVSLLWAISNSCTVNFNHNLLKILLCNFSGQCKCVYFYEVVKSSRKFLYTCIYGIFVTPVGMGK